jgi:hypothetical protein
MRNVFAIIALLVVTSAYAQDDLNRSVDVAKEYTPLVERAQKLPVAPQIDDTTTLKPDFRYVVRPRAWVSRFEVTPIRAARMVTVHENPKPFYAKLGGGAPGQTVADVYYASKNAGAYLNHNGQWADIQAITARSVNNSAGIFGRFAAGRWMLGGELSIDDDNYADYIAGGRKVRYTTPQAAFAVEHKYFSLDAEGWFLQQRDEAGGRVDAEIRRRFGEHFLHLGASASGWNRNNIIGVSPRYEFDNKRFMFIAGATVARDDAKNKLWFLPELELRLSGGVSPYLKLGGNLRDNTYRTLVAVNPYFDPRFRFAEAPGATAEHTLYAGLSGRLGYVVAWNIFAGGEMSRNVLLESSATPYFAGKIDALSAGLELDARAGGFTASLDAKYFNYKQLRGCLPAYRGVLSANYAGGNWAIRASAATHGGYCFFGTEHKAPAATDLTLEAEYKFTERITVFAEGNNLLDQKLYPYALHCGIGRSVGMGVKLRL